MSNEVLTFGCRLNAYETEVIKDNLAKSGEDNIAVFNSCSVTKEAERQLGQSIRRYRKDNPDKKIVITGCAVQIDPQKYANMAEVDYVIGNHEKMSSDAYDFSPKTEKIRVNDIMSVKETANHMISGYEDKARAFLQIQNGCNHRCTFCIIPYGRGNSRSVPVAEIVSHSKNLVEQGYNEIVLTGVDISDYGKDLPASPSLGEVIRRLLKIVPIARLRLSSIDVAEIDDELLDIICHEPRFMPHLHLSLQSGDDMVLKRMARRHTRQDVIDFAKIVRASRPDIVFGADIIAGFPTESEEMFQNTLDLVREISIPHLHVFPYSEREGTPAARIPANKQVPVPIRKERAKILREAGEQELQKLYKWAEGKTHNVIVEKGGVGRSEHFLSIPIDTSYKIGELVKITT